MLDFVHMPEQICEYCQRKNAHNQCGLCATVLCKRCTHFVEQERFALLPSIPLELSHGSYCGRCLDQTVSPQIVKYDELVARARNVAVYEKKQGKETRLLKRLELPVTVTHCSDYEEAILRLAVQAAQAGYNGLVDLELKAKKLRNAGYQKKVWSGSAVPVHIDPAKIPKDRAFWQNPN